MDVADDLIAVRTLLILQGRARGTLKADDGRVCLRQAMLTVSISGNDIGVFEDPQSKLLDDEADWYQPLVAAYARDVAMFNELLKHVPSYPGYPPTFGTGLLPKLPNETGCDVLGAFNDSVTDDVIFSLIEKTLADLGAI